MIGSQYRRESSALPKAKKPTVSALPIKVQKTSLCRRAAASHFLSASVALSDSWYRQTGRVLVTVRSPDGGPTAASRSADCLADRDRANCPSACDHSRALSGLWELSNARAAARYSRLLATRQHTSCK